MNVHEVQKQTTQPLFPNIFWEAPLNKKLAKKLLIVGGHSKQFAHTLQMHKAVLDAGIGEAKVVLPESLKRYVGVRDECLFVSSTPSGSIAKTARDEIISFANEYDGVVFSDELSHNTETISLLESIFSEITKPLFFETIVMNMLLFQPGLLTHITGALSTDVKSLMKLSDQLKLPINIARADSFINKVNLFRLLSQNTQLGIIELNNQLLVGYGGHVSSTQIGKTTPSNIELLANMAVFWLQHQNHFEALTSAAFATCRPEKK